MLFEEKNRTVEEASEGTSLFEHLQGLLTGYLREHGNLSLNGLSKRCRVSEPTLRRIRNGQVKTLPNVSTIFTFLSYILDEVEAEKIVKKVGEPLGSYLKERAQVIESFKKIEFSEDLSEVLKDPVKYVIYKLAAGGHGLTHEKVFDLFGSYGEKQLQSLVNSGWMYREKNFYYVKTPYFALSHEVFVEHFKTMADFIKPEKHANATAESAPLFTNYSGSIHKEAYKEIRKIYKKAAHRAAEILNDPHSKGNIPTFVLSAVDTIDAQCADEFGTT